MLGTIRGLRVWIFSFQCSVCSLLMCASCQHTSKLIADAFMVRSGFNDYGSFCTGQQERIGKVQECLVLSVAHSDRHADCITSAVRPLQMSLVTGKSNVLRCVHRAKRRQASPSSLLYCPVCWA